MICYQRNKFKSSFFHIDIDIDIHKHTKNLANMSTVWQSGSKCGQHAHSLVTRPKTWLTYPHCGNYVQYVANMPTACNYAQNMANMPPLQ